MDADLLNVMQCQSCHTGFRLMDLLVGTSEQVDFGIACCDCAQYPIIAGILTLDVGVVGHQLLSFLRQSELDAAFALAHLGGVLAGPVLCAFLNVLRAIPGIGPGICRIFSRALAIVGQRLRRRYDSQPFCEAVGRGTYSEYLKNRFSLDNFWLLLPCLPAMHQLGGMVLDLCCGAGHASFLISQTVKPERIISADHTFKSVYLAKQYMTPHGFHICLDAGAPLPFRSGVFSSVLIIDAMHYIPARQLLATEIERALVPGGMVFLLHLHNALSTNAWHQGGFALSPAQWAGLFRNLDCSVVPEEKVLQDFLYEGLGDLVTVGSWEWSENSSGLCLFGGRASGSVQTASQAWQLYQGVSSQLIINPLYKVRREDGVVSLVRLPADKTFKERYRISSTYLPGIARVPDVLVPFVEDGTRKLRIESPDHMVWEAVSDLMRRFLVIPVPPHYSR